MRARFYGSLLGMRVSTSLTTGMQYRWDFLIDMVMSLFWAGVSLLPLAYGFRLLGRTPEPAHVAAALLLLVAAVAVLYSVWLLVVCVAFWVVRLDNLAYLFMAVFDFARWPVSIFKGALRFVFTFV